MYDNLNVSILLVIKNEEKALPLFFKHIINQSHKNISVYLFDNGSTDNSVSVATSLFPGIKTCVSQTNIGFAKANNTLAEKAFSDEAEFIFVLNPDLVLDKFCIEVLIREHQNNKKIGLLAPIMLSGDSTKINSFGTNVNFETYKEVWPFRNNLLLKDLPEIHIVDTVGGGVTFLPKSSYLKTGLFEESFFIYGEEIDLGYRVYKNSLKTAVAAKAVVHRYHDEIKDKDILQNFKYYYKTRAVFLYLHKHNFIKGIISNFFKFVFHIPNIIKLSIRTKNSFLLLYYLLGLMHGLFNIKGKSKLNFRDY